jgi:metal-responsive CopG/Arc/MetJ family transcriptional regulator
MKKGKKHPDVVTFRCPEDLRQQIEKAAKADQRPRSNMIIVLLREALQARKDAKN